MLILEHDAKAILAGYGVAVPEGVLIEQGCPYELPPGAGPWIAKAQVPVGGRGKAGGIRSVADRQELPPVIDGLLGSALKGHRVGAVRVERAIQGAHEAYLSLSVHPRDATVTILMAAAGGMDVEEAAALGLLRGEAPAEPAALSACIATLAGQLPAPTGPALAALGGALVRMLLERDALLVEVNPVFVRPDGSWVAGDAKLVLDDNALDRQPGTAALLRERTAAYHDERRKAQHGFDFVTLDPAGSVGLVTTGAGLSMMLIDEMTERGLKPFNFCDIRTGQFRGDPTRLIQVLRWIADGPAVRTVLVNIFAGITDLREFAGLLLQALEAVPALRVPIVARLVGNGADGAAAMLAGLSPRLVLEPDLDRAVDLVDRLAGRADA